MAADRKKPNILLLMPDQLRADFLGCYGAAFARTPNLDRLAASGRQYKNAISPHPLCVPARAALLTGHNAVSTGVLANGSWLRPDHAACGMPTIAEILADNGYLTAAFGKMHFMPWDIAEGFRIRRIAEDKRHVYIEDDYHDYLASVGFAKSRGPGEEGYAENLMASFDALPPELQVDSWVADETVRFIRRHGGRGEPFFAMVGFPGPHDPYNPPKAWTEDWDPSSMPESHPPTEATETFRQGQIRQNRLGSASINMEYFPEDVKRRVRIHYSALTSNIDAGIGRVLAALDDRGLNRNTVVIATSDHGDLLGDFGLLGKNNFLEPSIRIPLIVRAPGIGPAGCSGALVTLTDLFATIAEFAGIETSGRGDSIALPELGLVQRRAREVVLGALGSGFMMTDGRYKLARYANGLATLSDRVADPAEQSNLLDRPDAADVALRLDAAMTRELLDALFEGNVEKGYDYATMDPAHPSHQRGWSRPYPISEPPRREVQPI
ncbi:MAG: sulfatase-like hydrolase/transferase [Albidovulum sp.]|nr:sulfatase-like hydrolase/transferase [Albidovulum sp.]